MSAYLCDLCGNGRDFRGVEGHVSCEVPGQRPCVKRRIPLPQGFDMKRAKSACYDFKGREET